MKFITLNGEDFSIQKRQYERYNFINVFVSDRNWFGTSHILFPECAGFLHRLHELEEEFTSLFFYDKKHTTNLNFYIDTSCFNTDERNYNKILTFLYELDEFYTFIPHSKSDEQTITKAKKKLRSYLSSVSNFPFLYRWIFSNPKHPFASELFEEINFLIKEQAVRFKSALTKDVLGYVKKKEQHELRSGYVKVHSTTASTKEGAFFSQIFEHAFEEPSVFYFASQILLKYSEELNKLLPHSIEFESGEFVYKREDSFFLLTRPQKKLFIKRTDLFPRLKNEDNIYKYQSVIDTFISDEVPHPFFTFSDITTTIETLEKDKINVLKVIASWAEERISKNSLGRYPKTGWTHEPSGEIFNRIGIEGMTITPNYRFVSGKEGEEVFIEALTQVKEKTHLFPIISPKDWSVYNAEQCAVMTYIICLLHDICVEQNYEIRYSEELEMDVIHVLEKDRKKIKRVPSPKGSVKKKEETKEEDKIRRHQHWVSFHFRRLRGNQSASEEAKANALRYGIRQLPIGFTFVDSFLRGEKDMDLSSTKISALEVLKRTLNKLEHIDDEIEECQNNINELKEKTS